MSDVKWEDLRLAAETFYEIQEARKAVDNRLGAGVRRNALGVATADQYDIYAVPIRDAEMLAEKQLLSTYKNVVPEQIRRWVDEQRGLGHKLLARLLGHLGDPRIASPHHWEGTGEKRVLVADDRYYRTVGQLWSYCGHGDPLRKKVKGMSAEDAMQLGSPTCKMLVWNLAGACVKAGLPKPKDGTEPIGAAANQDPKSSLVAAKEMPELPKDFVMPKGSTTVSGSTILDAIRETQPTADALEPSAFDKITGPFRYRGIYDARRERTAQRVHNVECVRCGPSGKPAQPGMPWNPGHQHADALRIVGKEILRDLWIVAG